MKTVSISLLVLLFGFIAHAQTTPPVSEPARNVHVHKTVIKDIDSDRDDDYPSTRPTPQKESVITTKFGSKGQSGTMGCKTEDLVKDVIRDLKADCKAWVNDQKTDLKERYLTSTCEESCDDCGSALRRCNVTGTVHYLVPDHY